MKKIKNLLLLFLMFFTIAAFGQTNKGKVVGTVIDGNTKTIESATIALLKATDSSVAKMSVADKTGRFTFEGIAEGKYIVSISAIGHTKGFSEVFEINASNLTVTLKTIELMPVVKSIGGVTVTARKPLIEQKIDRTIVNVEAAATNVGATALEVLEKSPGVSVDKDGNISLKGKQGVQIYIDGRPTYLSGTDLTNLLSNMNSNQLDQIEIMTNPPAKYEAAGNSGIINIKTKKTKQLGYNGSISSTYTQGRLPKASNSFNFNYRKNKVNLFTNLSQSYRRNFQHLDIQRKFIDPNTKEVKSNFGQRNTIREGGENYSVKLGMDYFASKKTTFGIVLNGYQSPGTFNNFSDVKIFDPFGVLQSNTLANTTNDRKWKHGGANLNFRHVFDSTGRELTADADYLTYRSTNGQSLINNYFDASGLPFIQPDTLLGNLPQQIDIYSGKIDYSHPLKNGAKFEAGLKTSFVNTDNDGVYNNVINNRQVLDSGRSNHFIYKENVNAAYVNFSKQFNKKWSGQFGLRLENTNSDGHSSGYEYNTVSNKFVFADKYFKRNYTQLFPTAYLQYSASEKHSFVLNYGRRIDRPDYEDLNPFILFLDKYTFEQGNPNLSPQFSHNIELTHTYKGFLNTTLNYTKTTDIINEVLEQNTDRNETFVKKANIANQQQFGLAISAGGPIKKWWTANMYANVYNNRFRGIVNGDYISIGATTGQFNLTNQFKFAKTWGAEIGGFYRTPGVDGVFKIQGIGAMNMAFSKQVLKGKGTVRLNFRDVLYTQKAKGVIKYSNIDATFQQERDSRQVALNFTYRFSKGKVGNMPKRKTGGADEEKNRVNTGEN